MFGFASYLFGHFIFLIGSWLLDKHVYDRLRKPTYQQQIKRLSEGKPLSALLPRYLSRVFFAKDADSAVSQAVRIKEHYLDPIESASSINAFQWSKARLTLENPEASAAVQRFEADSKFFRSLVILCLLILTVLAPFGLLAKSREVAWVSVPLLGLALWRYMDQRCKATNQAYWYIITLEGKSESTFLRPSLLSGGPSHAGGVVFRHRKNCVEYLLVRAKEAPHEWVLPKGHIERGEDMKQTAVREVREETGVWARITRPLKCESFLVDETTIHVQFYLMEAVEGRLDRLLSRLGFSLLTLVKRWTEHERRERT